MKQLIIEGGHELSGTIRISGAKNCAVALIPAAVLANEKVTLCNVPNITDIDVLVNILEDMGVTVNRATGSLVIDPSTLTNTNIKPELSDKMRASYYFLGALLGKYKHSEMYFPGGCSIGKRPINLHLMGFEALGATVTNEGDKYVIDAKELHGADIEFDIASVGATINIMLAAVHAKGVTHIKNAAKEPEIVAVADMLNRMGAKITGEGTPVITIEGVKELHGCNMDVIPDRIEAGTYAVIGALCGNMLKVDNIVKEHLNAFIEKLDEIGVFYDLGEDYIYLSKGDNYKAIDVKTEVYPGFPTDLQQVFNVLLTQCDGVSHVNETIYENRFMHVPHLNALGADISVDGRIATINGPTKLKGTEVVATDLRAGAAMVIAGLIAEGTTVINNAEHVLRGYEGIVEKLTNVGAHIEIKEVENK